MSRKQQLVELLSVRGVGTKEQLEAKTVNELEQKLDQSNLDQIRAQVRKEIQTGESEDGELSLEAQERHELLDQHNAAKDEARLQQLFRTVVNRKVLIDCEATRNQIWALLDGAPLDSISVQWLVKLLKESPSQFAWQDVVDPKTQAAANKQQLEADRKQFEDFAKSSELCSIIEANWSVIYNALGPGLDKLSISVVQLPEGPCVLTEDGETHQLIPATPVELAQWAQERFEADQENLVRMAANNDIEALRARARRDRERATPAVEQLEFQLSKGFEKEVLQGRNVTPLPQTWQGKPLDSAFIRALNRHDPNTRILIERFGNCRLTARLHGLKTVRRFDSVGNPIPGEYVFEN